MPEDMMPLDPATLRVLYFERTSAPVQIVYTVAEGKVLVLTAWTLTSESGQPVTARLRRNKVRVGFSKIWEPSRGHNHIAFPSGIAFVAGDEIEIEGTLNNGQHYFYGYEVDG